MSGAPVMMAKLRDVLARQTSSRGGLSETEVKEFAVKPIGFPSPSQAVTTVTPVGKAPNASRNALGSTVWIVIVHPPPTTATQRAAN